MKILFTLHNFLPEPILGAEQVCVQQMRELLKRGCQVGLFYAGNKPVSEAVLAENGLKGVTLFRVSFFDTKAQVILSTWNLRVRRRFESAVNSFLPDVIIFHHLVRLSLDLPSVGWRRKIPLVYYFHDFYPICPSYSLFRPNHTVCPGGGVMKCALCLYESRFGRRALGFPLPVFFASLYIFLRNRLVSKFTEQISLFISPSYFLLREMASRGFYANHSVVVQNGSDMVKRDGALVLMRQPRFGYIGGMHPKKGIETLVKAFQGPLGKRLLMRGFTDPKALSTFRRAHPEFQATMEVYETEKESFFDQIDVLVVPSVWYENQPNVIIEAYHFGKPVVCSDIGGMREMVRHNETGLLFQPGDANDLRKHILYLLNRPSEVARLAAAIPKWPPVSDNVDKLVAGLAALKQCR